MLPLITLRLQNQLLVQPPFDAPQQVVEWMGAVQAQDYRMAKWAVGCRTASTDATQIEAALNRGDILRTHLLRPTWHFGFFERPALDALAHCRPHPCRQRLLRPGHRRRSRLQIDSPLHEPAAKDAGREQTPDERGNRRSAESAGHSALAICAAASADAGRNGRHRLQRRRQEGHRDLRPSRRTGSARRRTFP